jgi:hypothetical protein
MSIPGAASTVLLALYYVHFNWCEVQGILSLCAYPFPCIPRVRVTFNRNVLFFPHVARGWYECSYHQPEHVLVRTSATESPQSQKNKILDSTPHLANLGIHLPLGYVTDSQVF